MSSRQKSPITRPMRRTRRRLKPQRRFCRSNKSPRIAVDGESGGACSSVSDKLEALKSLIPAHNGEITKPDQLFQETADYIVLLKTQVSILQRLVDFYGSSSQNQNAV